MERFIEFCRAQGQRVVAFATREAADCSALQRFEGTALAEQLLQDLTVVGLVSLQESSREGVQEAVLGAMEQGVNVALFSTAHPVAAAEVSSPAPEQLTTLT